MDREALEKFALGTLYRIQNAIKDSKDNDAILQICNFAVNYIKSKNTEMTAEQTVETNSKYEDIF